MDGKTLRQLEIIRQRSTTLDKIMSLIQEGFIRNLYIKQLLKQTKIVTLFVLQKLRYKAGYYAKNLTPICPLFFFSSHPYAYKSRQNKFNCRHRVWPVV